MIISLDTGGRYTRTSLWRLIPYEWVTLCGALLPTGLPLVHYRNLLAARDGVTEVAGHVDPIPEDMIEYYL